MPISDVPWLEVPAVLGAIEAALLHARTPAAIVRAAVDGAGPALACDRAVVYDTRPGDRVAMALGEWLRSTAVGSRLGTSVPLGELDPAVHGRLAYPIRRRDGAPWLAVFERFGEGRTWSDGERAAAASVAAQIGITLEMLERSRELRRSEERFQLLYDHTPSMYFIVDREGITQRVNRFGVEHLGYAAEELVGHSVLEIVHPCDREKVTRDLAACFADHGSVHRLSFRKIRKDGSTIWVKEAARVADGPEGPTALIVCEDATEARVHEEAARAAETRAHHKDEFMAMLGHELRNPLTPIVTALELLRMGGARAPELDVIDRQVSHLQRLVDDLLDVSRITRGKVELRMQRLELIDIAAGAIEIAEPIFRAKRQPLAVAIPERGLLLDADPARLVQAFSNLLTNASKYSGEGQEVVFSAERRGDRIVAEVRDHGDGIEPHMLERVFELFEQRPQASDRAQSGLGLGLTIVRNLVTLHGGTVRARSAGRGSGTTLEVELPAATGETPSSGDPRRFVASGSARAEPIARVLVADDNVDVREMLCKAITLLGYEAIGAKDGPAALSEAASAPPTVAFVDIGLPGMDGYEVARRLRAAWGGRIRLIAVSGYGLESDIARAHESGFDVHLTKPVNLDQLRGLLAQATRR